MFYNLGSKSLLIQSIDICMVPGAFSSNSALSIFLLNLYSSTLSLEYYDTRI